MKATIRPHTSTSTDNTKEVCSMIALCNKIQKARCGSRDVSLEINRITALFLY